MDDSGEDKKSKGMKKCVIKKKLQFQNQGNFLEPGQLENKINHLKQNKTR